MCSQLEHPHLLMADTPSPKELAEIEGVRINYGPSPYYQIIKTLKKLFYHQNYRGGYDYAVQ